MAVVRDATPTIDRLLILLAQLGREEEDDEWIRQHVGQVEGWGRFFDLAHDNRVVPRSYQELRRLDLLDASPRPVRERLAAESARIETANLARVAAGIEVLRALRNRGLDIIVLKGVAFAQILYGNPGYKRMNDIDLLVHREDVPTVMEVYAAHGLVPIAERVGGDPERQLTVTHHLPPYVTRDVRCMLGTQWDFRSPLLGHDFALNDVWDRSVPLTLEGVELRTLGPEDAVHHVCLHLERFRTGIRDVMDLHNLVFAFRDRFDWDLFAGLVESAGTYDDVYYGLCIAHAHRPHPEVDRLLQRIAPKSRKSVRRMAEWRSRSPRVLVRVCSRQFSTIEKAVTAFNATGVLREKLPLFLAGWGSIFWPPVDDALKISAYTERTVDRVVRARVVAPYLLLQAIAEELGGLLLAGLAIKSLIDLVRAAVPGRNKENLDGYARRLGLDLDRLNAVQNHIQ